MPARKPKHHRCARCGCRPCAATVNAISCNGDTLARYPGLLPEPRPAGASTVKLFSRFPSQAYMRDLVRDLGYSASAAIACIYNRAPIKTDRRTRKPCPNMGQQDGSEPQNEATGATAALSHPDHPYIAEPARRTTVGGGCTREQITYAIGEMNLSNDMAEVLYQVNICNAVAEVLAMSRGLKVGTVYAANSRLKKKLAKLARKTT